MSLSGANVGVIGLDVCPRHIAAVRLTRDGEIAVRVLTSAPDPNPRHLRGVPVRQGAKSPWFSTIGIVQAPQCGVFHENGKGAEAA